MEEQKTLILQKPIEEYGEYEYDDVNETLTLNGKLYQLTKNSRNEMRLIQPPTPTFWERLF